jgi:tetratricopeptide (TPR) repeat protein
MKRFFVCLCLWPLRHWRLSVPGVVVLAVCALGAAWYSAQYHLRAARQARQENRLADARQHIEKSLRRWRFSSEAHLLAARLARLDSDYPALEKHLAECRWLGGATEEAQLELTLARAERGDMGRAQAGFWRKVEEDHPDKGVILEAMARWHHRHYSFGPALKCLDRWVAEEPDSFLALVQRGEIHEALLQHEAAESDYTRALDIIPGQLDIGVRLVNLMFRLHRPCERIKPYLERLEQGRADQPEVRVLVARYHLLSGELDEASRLLEGMLADDQESVDVLALLGEVELQRARPAAAEQWIRKALDRDPVSLPLVFALYRALSKQPGREKEARRVFQQHESIKADTLRLQVITKQITAGLSRGGILGFSRLAIEGGLIMMRLRQEQAGARWLEMGVDLLPEHREARRVLIEYYDRIGDRDRAAEHRRRAARTGTAPGKAEPP